MAHVFSDQELLDFEAIISPPRFATYLREVGGDRHRALELHCWNTDISAAFYILLQFCELAVRNAAVEAIEQEFGANWHLNRGFAYTLPAPRRRRAYKPRNDLQSCAQRLPTAGKVVAELKFAFWQNLFVAGQDRRLWIKHFAIIFPGFDQGLTIAQARATVHRELEIIRKLRNRIAHHEPIFTRDLNEDKNRIQKLIDWRRPAAANWINSIESVSTLIANRPN